LSRRSLKGEAGWGGRLACTSSVVESCGRDGHPIGVIVHFDVDLEDPSLRWLQWKNGAYAPFEPPAVGNTVTLPSVIVPWK
jgi:hypothetical protein